MSTLLKQNVSLSFKSVDDLKKLLCQNDSNSADFDDVPFLQRVKTATIPTFDVVVVANDKNFIVSTSIEENKGSIVGAQTPLVTKTLDDFITSVACWPVAPSRLTDPRPYEWTGIILGLKNGVLNFFTDRGYLLMKQQFSRTNVVEIRVETDQLSILYQDCYVVVNGLTLLAALKSCRQKVARGEPVDDEVNVVEILSQKYSLEACPSPRSVASTGIHKQTLWDQMTTASNCGGVNAKLGNGGSSTPSQSQTPYDTFCAVGQDSFVSFNWYADSLRRTDFISETLHSVTNRFKSSFGLPSMLTSSIWGASSSSSTTKKQKMDPVIDQQRIIKVPQRTALFDLTRKSEQVIVSPNGRLAAIADAHARVILLDVRKRLALRVWKGYRDAQCGWFEIGGRSESKNASKNLRKTLCLVIFAPKRGILEVWAAQNGRRIAAFNVDKEGLLLYCPPTSSPHSNSSDALTRLRFVDSHGHFHVPSVSFDVAVDKRSTSTFWTAEMKEVFRSWWSSPTLDDDELFLKLCSTVSSISNAKDLRYLVDIVIKTDFLSFRLAAKFVEAVLNRLNELCADENQKPTEIVVFLNYCTALKQCINFFAVVSALSTKNNVVSTQETDDNSSILETLIVDETFLLSLCQDLDDNMSVRASKEASTNASKETKSVNLSTFLTYIDVVTSHSHINNDNTTLPVRLSTTLTDEDLILFGDFLFTPFLTTFAPSKFERDLLPLFGLNVDDWIILLCRFWLDSRRSYSVHPRRLYKMFLTIFSACEDRRYVGINIIKARDILMNSSRSAECVCLCLVLRAVAKNFQSQACAGDEWEKIEANIEDWDVLMKILHGLLLLDTFSRRYVNVGDAQTTLNDVISIGYGFPAEELAKRFVDCDNDEVTPTALIKAFHVDAEDFPSVFVSSKESLKKLLEIFPSSLSTVAVAANCCWENIRRWFSNVGNVIPLRKGVEYLNLIENIFVRRGLAALIWHKFLSGYIEELCLVLDDCQNGGEDVDERFWLKTQIPGRSLLTFVKAVLNVCKILYDDTESADDASSSRNFESEDFLHEFFDSFAKNLKSRNALVNIAADQPTIDKRKGRVHYVLSLILTIIVEQQGALSESSPYVLFSEIEEDLLFERLHTDLDASVGDASPNNAETFDKRLQNRRLTFLKSWITAVLSQNSVDPNVQNAFDLASLWSVNVDELRRHEVYQLFASNHADVATKYVHLVEDRCQLAKDLLDLVCKSLCVQMQRSKVKPGLTTRLETYLLTFKDVALKSSKAVSVNIQTCNSIMLFVSSALPRKSEQNAIAKDLRTVIENLSRSEVAF